MNDRRIGAWLCLPLVTALAVCSCSDNNSSAAGEQTPAAGTPGTETAAIESTDVPQPATDYPEGYFGSRGSFLSTFFAEKYIERCSAEDADERECEVLRGLVVVETVLALREIEASRDQRGAEEALASLDIVDEPEILVAALRILGRFPETPGIAEKTWPLLLESAYLSVQQTAANVLASNPDPTLAAVGIYWRGNHGSLFAENDYQEYPDFAPHYPGMGFPEYPDAEWFSPADSDRSVGWSTGHDFATVSAWLSDQLGAEGLTYQQWAERLAQESMAVFQAIDPGKQAELERLIEEWTKTMDLAVLEKLQKLQEEMYAPMEAAGEMADKGVASLGPPIATETQEQVRYFVAEERAGHVARVVMVYPLSSLGHTVIQHGWSLADYPSAWPPTEEDPAQDQ